ncbi:DUF6884 domain-containing protein [Streptomyces sp900116325]|uniref:DUF6884 domain-containing protein n=1 Tax=Streptomyces sp. 900116325 TaxID=3154295 RepID=UPI0033A5907E
MPCSAAKLSTTAPVPAADLYAGSFHRVCRRAAHAIAGGTGTVLVLSAAHGFVTLDEPLAPYELRMGEPGSVQLDQPRAQAERLGLHHHGLARIRVGPGLARTRPRCRTSNRAHHRAPGCGRRGTSTRHGDGSAARMAPTAGRLNPPPAPQALRSSVLRSQARGAAQRGRTAAPCRKRPSTPAAFRYSCWSGAWF